MKIINRQFTKITKTLIFSGAMVFAANTIAANNLIPRIPANKLSLQYKVFQDIEYQKIIVKFKESTGIRLGDVGLTSIVNNPEMPAGLNLDWSAFNSELTGVQNLASANGGNLSSLYTMSANILESMKVTGEQRSGKQLADLNLYFKLPIPSFFNATQIQGFIDSLNAFQSIEISYAEPKAEIAAITPDFQEYDPGNNYYQGYLDAPNSDDTQYDGINAKYAWNFSGGRGEGIKVMDVEGGWNTNHEDLPTVYEYIGTEYSADWVPHGTAVVGVIAGADNGFGVTGITSQVSLGVSSISQGTSTAITSAANSVGEGGIVLIEVHKQGPTQVATCSCNSSQCNYIAVEYWQSDFDAIQTATANGIIVVEAAGNGSADLDDAVYEGKFDRSARDSGAILVAGGASKSRSPMCWTNYGSRIDVHGWGEYVTTLAYGGLYKNADDINNKNQWYTATFSGTSSASPVIVGAAASLQGIAQNVHGETLTPAQMRDLLTSTGTIQTIETSKNIGPLPDLEKAIAELDGIFNTECTNFEATNSQHQTSGRAYSTTETTGETCIGLYCWGGTTTTTWYAQGSDDNLGTSDLATTTLHESAPGVFSQGACPTPDVTAPVITILGDNPATAYLGSIYNDAGAAADDDTDGDITANIVITGSVDTSTIGIYELTYTATDAADNQASAVRTVEVINVPACQDYTDTVSGHETSGNAYSTTETTGETCFGTICWGGTTTTTWYAQGSDENLGTNGSAIVTLRTSENGYVTGTCPTDPIAPVISDLDYTVNGQNMVVTANVTDANDDILLVRLMYSDQIGELDCTNNGGDQYTCDLVNHQVGTYNFKVYTIDSVGNTAETAPFSVEFVEQIETVCITDTNFNHVGAGRAYIGGISNLYTYATGSGDDLGLYGSIYYSTTTSLEETSAGVWTLVSNCN